MSRPHHRQRRRPPSPIAEPCFAGVDLGRDSLTLTVINHCGDTVLPPTEYAMSPAGLKKAKAALAAFADLAIAYEPTGNPSGIFLKAFDGHEKLFEINGRVIRSRSLSMTQTKTDAADARAIAQILRDITLTEPKRLEQYRAAWCERRANLTLLATEYAERAEDLRRIKVRADYLRSTPAPAARQLRRRVTADLSAALKAQQQAKRELVQAAKQCNAEMFELLLSIPGIGDVMAAALVREIGDIRKFESADALKGFLGVYPARRQSGKTEYRARLARHGNARLKAALFMGAQSAARHNPVCHALFQRLVAKGKKPIVAIGAVMRKLIQLVYGILKNKQPFQSNFA